MAFESGSVSFRMFYVPCRLEDDIHEKFAEHVLGSVDALTDGEITGWVGHRHLLDREISEVTAWPSGFLRLTLAHAQRKIPTSLLQAECRLEEAVWMAAESRDYVNRTTKSEIKEQVTERLLPDMPAALKGIDFCYDRSCDIIYASALSDVQMEAFLIQFTQSTGIKLIEVDPVSAAWKEAECRADQWPMISFAAEQWADCAPGREFFMWLWYMSEAQGGEVELPGGGKFAVLVEGPLQFDHEEQGEAVIRKGEPMLSAETRAALLSGKKLRKGKLTLARGDEAWTVTLDADVFTFRGLKMPKTEAIDAEGRFQERMEQIDIFRQAFLGMFTTFCKLRNDETTCKMMVKEMGEWMITRPSRKLAGDK